MRNAEFAQQHASEYQKLVDMTRPLLQMLEAALDACSRRRAMVARYYELVNMIETQSQTAGEQTLRLMCEERDYVQD